MHLHRFFMDKKMLGKTVYTKMFLLKLLAIALQMGSVTGIFIG